MSIELSIHDDFSTILDGGEPITLQRRASAETIAIAVAWRFTSLSQPLEPGVAAVAQADVVWQFGWDASQPPPRSGDVAVDGAGEGWTILAVERRGNGSRLRCTTRNLRIVYSLIDQVEIQQAIWDDLGGGPEIVGWETLRSATPARIQPLRTLVDHTADPPTSTTTARVLLDDPTALDHRHRLVAADGTIYQILEYAAADRIDTVPVATVVRLADA